MEKFGIGKNFHNLVGKSFHPVISRIFQQRRLHILEKYLHMAPKIRILKPTIWKNFFALYGKKF